MPKFINRVGETNKADNGQMMTIVVCRNSRDIDVQFEDGMIITHTTYRRFCSGVITNPNMSKYAAMYIGQVRISNNGQKMTLIAYRSARDIDVQFEDGTVVTHREYACFDRGEIRNPNFYKNRVGEVREATNGQKMTIIAYRKYNDIDVQFEDGTIIKHKSYTSFINGLIHNPNYTHNVSQRKYRTGLSKLANCGLMMTISLYRKYKNIDAIFETGYEVKHQSYREFEKGNIGHPFPYQIGFISMDKPAYVYNGVGNFYCRCSKCHKSDIMTISEMKSHICNK